MDAQTLEHSRICHRDYVFDLFASRLQDLQSSDFALTFAYLTERLPDLIDAWEWASQHNQPEAFSPTLFEAVHHLLADRGYNRLYLQLAQQAVMLFGVPENARHFQLRMHAQLMHLYGLNWYTQDFKTFCDLSALMMQELRSCEEPYLLAQCLKLRGWYMQYHQYDFGNAEQLFEEAYHLFKRVGALQEASRVLNDLGLVAQERDSQLAIRWWQQSLEQAYSLNDPRLEAVLLCNLAELHLKQKNTIEAEIQFIQALDLQTEHYGVELSAHSGLALIYLDSNDLDQALHHAQQAVDRARVRHQKGDLVIAYTTLARVFVAMQRQKAAKQQLSLALRIAHQEKDQHAVEEIKGLLRSI